MKNIIIQAYKRENLKYGIRNYVLAIPLDAVSYQVCRGIASLVDGVKTFYHPYGRMQFGKDLDVHFRTLIGTGCNPNVAAVIVVGIEPVWTNKIADAIKQTGKPVSSFSTVENGDLKTIERASRVAIEYVKYATSLKRTEVSIGELSFGLKCGESDTTSGFASNPSLGKTAEMLYSKGSTLMFGETPELTGMEDIIYDRFKQKSDAETFKRLHSEYIEMINFQGYDLLGSQPNQGNIAGGISTIEEKAVGNIQKIGNLRIDGILDIAEEPDERGFYFMNTSSAAADLVTGMAAAGTVMNLFTTGKGNNIGNPIVPVLKICGNIDAVKNSAENIDVDVSDIMFGKMNIDTAANKIMTDIIEVCNGRWTTSEILRHNEYAVARFFPQS